MGKKLDFDEQLISAAEWERILEIHSTIRKSGESCYLVGGAVRDWILGKPPKEFDFATSAPPEKVKKLFRRVIETGIQHGTVTVLIDHVPYEITTYRTEEGFTDGRRPDTVAFSRSLEEDLKRRDFTINALALDPATLELIDQHNGWEDIRNKLIRTIGDPVERFREDGLRPIRGIRFVSTLGFRLDPETEAAFSLTKEITGKIARERFSAECEKLFRGEQPWQSWDLLCFHGYLEMFAGEIPSSGSGGSVYSTGSTGKGSRPSFWKLWESKENQNPNLGWSIGFYLSYPPEVNLSDGKERGEKIQATDLPEDSEGFLSRLNSWKTKITKICKNLKLSNQLEKEILFLGTCLSVSEYFSQNKNKLPRLSPSTNLFLKLQLYREWKDFQAKNPKSNLDFIMNLIPKILNLGRDDLADAWSKLVQSSPPVLLSDLAVDGRWLQSEYPEIQGKAIGEVLGKLLKEIHLNPEKNFQDAIREVLNSPGFRF
jgi:tRNA nucleotidyltransferase/poly(A) polymerase